MVSSASNLSALLARGLQRKLDANSFRGDVSEKIQVHSASSRFKPVWLNPQSAKHVRGLESKSKNPVSLSSMSAVTVVTFWVSLRHHLVTIVTFVDAASTFWTIVNFLDAC